VRCSVLQCVAVSDSVMQSNAVYCIIFKLHCFALFSVLQRVWQCVAMCWSILERVAVCCSVLPCIAV